MLLLHLTWVILKAWFVETLGVGINDEGCYLISRFILI